MAGLNLLINTSKKFDNLESNFKINEEFLVNRNIWDFQNVKLSISEHNGYPSENLDNEEFSVFIEGKVYNLHTQELRDKLKLLYCELNKEAIDKKAISDILFKIDGDYILVFFNKLKQKLFLLNDLYGRLPLYYANDEDSFIISRNQNVIIESFNLKEIDRYGVAEFLVFGHTVTERTLLKNVKYFLPGSLLTFDLREKHHQIQNIFSFNFESLVSVTSIDYKEKLDESVLLFKKAILQRKGSKSIFGLSGGLDSRILAAGFNQVCSDGECVSRLSFNNREKKDVALAQEVSEVLNMPFQVIKSEEPDKSFLYEIIKIKSGLNSIENDYNLIYEKKLQSKYGSDFTYFTGDAGDRIKPHIRIHKANNLSHFVDKLISTNSRIELGDVVKMLDIDINKFKKGIYKYIETFPEKSYGYKDLHFRIYSRGFRYVLEGEDRKRNYFWTVMPFYGHDFFLAAMSFPDKFKKDHKMFLDFMNLLDPKLSEVVNKNWGLKPSDWRLPFYLKKGLLPKGIKKQIRNILSLAINKNSVVNDNDKISEYLEENNLYDNEIYKELLISFGSNRSKELFIRTPVFLYKFLHNEVIINDKDRIK